MISETLFKAKMKEVSTLMNTNIKLEFVAEAYKRIVGTTFTQQDLNKAVEEILSGDNSRLTFPMLMKAMNNARGLRMDRESNERRMQEINDHQMFWDKRKAFEHEPCLERKCGSCPPDRYNYCEDIAARTCELIKQNLQDPSGIWYVNEQMAKEFPESAFADQLKNKHPRHTHAKVVNGEVISCDAQGNTHRESKLKVVKRRSYQEFINDFPHEED